MQVQIESTTELATLDGVLCRLWNGVTADGVPCLVYVHRIAVRDDRDSSQFEKELFAHDPPKPELSANAPGTLAVNYLNERA